MPEDPGEQAGTPKGASSGPHGPISIPGQPHEDCPSPPATPVSGSIKTAMATVTGVHPVLRLPCPTPSSSGCCSHATRLPDWVGFSGYSEWGGHHLSQLWEHFHHPKRTLRYIPLPPPHGNLWISQVWTFHVCGIPHRVTLCLAADTRYHGFKTRLCLCFTPLHR